MADEKNENVVTAQKDEEQDTNFYIEAIKEMKANTVDKQAYLKLKEENKQLLNSLVTGQNIEQPEQVEPVDIDALRAKLFSSKKKDLSNLEFVSSALELREALIERGDMDPFVPIGNKIKPTDEDFAKAQKVAKVLQECVDYADGDPNVFTDELKRRIN